MHPVSARFTVARAAIAAMGSASEKIPKPASPTNVNAAAAIVAGKKAKTLKDGFRLAQQALDSGSAADKLDKLIAYSKRAS